MCDKTKILLQLKIQLKDTFRDRMKDVILFGSQARNEETEYSDFDILIITDKPVTWQEKSKIRDICYNISLDFDIIIDSKIISQFEIDNNFWGKHPLVTDAIKFGIHAE